MWTLYGNKQDIYSHRCFLLLDEVKEKQKDFLDKKRRAKMPYRWAHSWSIFVRYFPSENRAEMAGHLMVLTSVPPALPSCMHRCVYTATPQVTKCVRHHVLDTIMMTPKMHHPLNTRSHTTGCPRHKIGNCFDSTPCPAEYLLSFFKKSKMKELFL